MPGCWRPQRSRWARPCCCRSFPPGCAGAGLTAFAAGLLGLYGRTPGMRKEGSPFPTQQGTALAKDVWMLGIGLGMVIDAATQRAPSPTVPVPPGD